MLATIVMLVVPGQGIGAKGGRGAATAQGKGALDLLEWPAFSDKSFASAFEQQTGCKIKRRDVGSSNQMVALMQGGGGGKYDLVSASGDIALLLVADHDVQPLDVSRIPTLKDVLPAFRSPAFNTVAGVHYGVAVQWVPNLLLYNTKQVRPAPSSWGAVYKRAHRGRISVPNDPLQIADAALYMMKARPSLGIHDPYELTRTQFAAALALLKRQKPLVEHYWNYAAEEVRDFKDGKAVLGSGWPYTALTLRIDKIAAASVIPREGATGFADSWMMAAKAPHPTCAYQWLKYVTTPEVQARQAIVLGETPVNPKACPSMDALQRGSCSAYHLDAAATYVSRIRFWKTPETTCGWGGRRDCVPFVDWERAWAQLGT